MDKASPVKIVTDKQLLKRLAEQGIDPEFVEFWHDYAPRNKGKEYSPYAKFYRDLKSNKRFMVVSGLPKVNAVGQKIVVGWDETEVGKKYKLKTNIFDAEIEERQVIVEVLNDQPSGAKKGDKVIWEPQLFLNGIEQSCSEPVLLDVDPINENYHQNTLEWDYGICKRRLRIIEGRLRERWFFAVNPNGTIKIKHNLEGKLKLGYAHDAKLNVLQVSVIGDEEIVEASELNKAIYPVEIGASATYYPDADAETSSVDGYAWQGTPDAAWNTLVVGAGSDAYDARVWLDIGLWHSDPTEPLWATLWRSIILFDTSGLPDGCTVSAATLTIYGSGKVDPSSAAPTSNVYASNPASNTALVAGDYNSLGSTAFCDTAIAYADWNTGDPGDPNDFAFNGTGIAAISKTSVSKFGTRNVNYDLADSAPPWGSDEETGLYAHSADKGTGYKPKLVVTYTVPAVGWGVVV